LALAAVFVGVMLPATAASRDTNGRGPAAAKPVLVRIVFSGKGGGRYLDITRWLEENTGECYARQTADETLSLSWTISWNAQLVTRGKRQVLIPAKRTGSTVIAGVTGDSVRDYCDQPEDGPGDVGPDWPGTTHCDGAMSIRSRGKLTVRQSAGRSRLVFQAPQFGSPPKPCELDVRNDQLVASVVEKQRMLDQFSAARTLTVPVGTNHPGPGTSYQPTRICSHFPHRYDGIVYLYDCEDTLVWNGTVTLSRVSG
jgi:hypothetical protein